MADAKSKIVKIPEVVTVKNFAEKSNLPVTVLITELMKNGILANINQQIDFDTAQIIVDEMGLKLKRPLAN